jgi:hypothetical protein
MLCLQGNVARFELDLDETPNVPPCAYPRYVELSLVHEYQVCRAHSTIPCADKLSWPTLTTNDSFVYNAVRYTLMLVRALSLWCVRVDDVFIIFTVIARDDRVGACHHIRLGSTPPTRPTSTCP